jgi:hypothetical protein
LERRNLVYQFVEPMEEAERKMEVTVTFFKLATERPLFTPLIASLYDKGLLFYDPRKIKFSLASGTIVKQAASRIFSSPLNPKRPDIQSVRNTFYREALVEAQVMRSILDPEDCGLMAIPFSTDCLIENLERTRISKQGIRCWEGGEARMEPEKKSFYEVKQFKEHRSEFVLWLHNDPKYLANGIIIPPKAEPNAPIIIYDVFTSHPFGLFRFKDINRSLRPKLQSVFPKRTIYTVLLSDLYVLGPKLIDRVDDNNDDYTNSFILDKEQLEKFGLKF